MRKLLFGLSALVLAASGAQAEEIHLMCNDGKHTMRVEIDTTHLHVKEIYWDGTSNDWQNGRVNHPSTIVIDKYSTIKEHCNDTVTVREDKILYSNICKAVEITTYDSEHSYESSYEDDNSFTLNRYTGILISAAANDGGAHCSPVAAGRTF